MGRSEGLLVFAWLGHRVSWGGDGEVWKLNWKQMRKVPRAVLSRVNLSWQRARE